MSLASIMALLSQFAPLLEPILLNADIAQLQPELKKLIAGVSSPDLQALLMALDAGLDSFVQAEIKKMVP